MKTTVSDHARLSAELRAAIARIVFVREAVVRKIARRVYSRHDEDCYTSRCGINDALKTTKATEFLYDHSKLTDEHLQMSDGDLAKLIRTTYFNGLVDQAEQRHKKLSNKLAGNEKTIKTFTSENEVMNVQIAESETYLEWATKLSEGK